jgi:hypothetical protein
MNNDSELSQACNQLIVSIEGLTKGSEFIKIGLLDGILELMHKQDCCESVVVEDFEGDVEDLLGHRLISAEEVINGQEEGQVGEEFGYRESTTWTFYKFRTTGGDLWVRWLGESNGYYSERVNVRWTPNGKRDEDQ